MEKTLDNLELKTDPPILIAQLDSLELMLYAVSGAVRDTLLLDFPCAKYIMNGVLLLSDDITSAWVHFTFSLKPHLGSHFVSNSIYHSFSSLVDSIHIELLPWTNVDRRA